MTSLAGDLPKFYRNLSDKVYHYEGDGAFSDLRQIIELQCDDPDNPSEEIAAFFDAINRAVPLKGATEKHWADEEEMLLSPEDFCGLMYRNKIHNWTDSRSIIVPITNGPRRPGSIC